MRHLYPTVSLPNSFNKSVVDIIWNKYYCNKNNNNQEQQQQKQEDHHKSLDELLNIASGEGFIEEQQYQQKDKKESSFSSYLSSLTTATKRYNWIHDEIQSAALSLGTRTETPEDILTMKYDIGKLLLSELTKDKEIQASLFLIVNLLNEGGEYVLLQQQQREKDTENTQQQVEEEMITYAKLNLRAAQKAVSFSAFKSAAKYAERGIQWLLSNHLKIDSTCYRTAVDLYSTAAEAEAFLGNAEKMESYYNEIVIIHQVKLNDQLRVQNVKMDYMGFNNEHKKAEILCLEILHRLGCHFPKRTVSTIWKTLSGIQKIRRKLTKSPTITTEELSKLPIVTDTTTLEIMQLLDKLGVYSVYSGSNMMPLSVIRRIEITLQEGLSEYSAPAFAFSGMIFIMLFSDFQAANTCAKHALMVLDRLECPNTRSTTLYLTHNFLLSWTKPMQGLTKPHLDGYQIGMASGNTESAMICIFQYLLLSLQSGKTLIKLEEDLQKYARQMEDLNKEKLLDYLQALWQMVLNLMGRSANTSHLEGHIIQDVAEFLDRGKEDPTIVAVVKLWQTYLYTIFGDYELGAELAILKGDSFIKTNPGNPCFMIDVFARGLSLYAMAQRKTTPKKKKILYQRHANKANATIQKWVTAGNPNIVHYNALLNAEKALLSGKSNYDQVEEYYRSSIIYAKRGGFIHDAALAAERLADFFLHYIGDEGKARLRCLEAISFYNAWGASRKVELLRDKYGEVIKRKQPSSSFSNIEDISSLRF